MISIKRVIYHFLVVVLIIGIKAVVIANDFESDTSKVNTLLVNAKNALDSNNISESFRLSNIAYELSNNLEFTYGKAKSLVYLGRIRSIKGKKDTSILNFKKALVLFNKINKEYDAGDVLNRLGNDFGDIGYQDSAEYYYNRSLEVRRKIDDKIGVAATTSNLGIVYNIRGFYSKALDYYFQSISILEEIDEKKMLSSTYSNIGIVFWNQGDFEKALEFFYKSKKIKEELKDYRGAALVYNNIGLVYQQSGDLEKALQYHNESLRIKKSRGDLFGMSFSYSNIGDIHQIQGDLDKALNEYSKAESLLNELSMVNDLANLYVHIGKLYRVKGELQKSLEFLKKAEAIYKTLDDPKGSSNSFIQISITYFHLGLLEGALSNCIKGITQAKQIRATDIVIQGYESLYKIHEKTGNISQAYNSYKLFILYRDSLNSIEKTKQLVKLQMQAEFDGVLRNQKQEQEQKLILAQGKSIKQTKITNIFILAFALTLSVFIVFYINNRQKQKHSTLLDFQKLDMERQRSELTFQRDELQIQKDLVIHQRDKIMTMLTDLGESIDYARKIQQALLPSDKALEKHLGEYYLFFQPRESVGGDFYWVAQNEQTTFFALGDCTGHGVPGGFMSMLGVSLLNELVSRSECSSPAKMLWDLREMIVKALSQTGLDEDSQDGMDIALCMYNSSNRHLVFAGANISLFLVTSTPPESNEKVIVQERIVELKPDRMPVSYYLRMAEFNDHHLVLNQGDCIYLSSDGYTDQFGGPNNKKFGYNTFKNLILSASNKPFEKQRDIFWNEFDKWKGEENQTDDVIVMGIKIS